MNNDNRNGDWIQAYIGLGSNIGDRCAYLKEAVRLLGDHTELRVAACSSIYETDPVGYVDQPAFLNMAVRADTRLAPEELLKHMLQVERKLGRVRDIRWGPRTVDLDLLLYGEAQIDTPTLTLPHPRMLERAFVLIPLKDVLLGEALPMACTLAARLATLEGKEGVKLWIDKL